MVTNYTPGRGDIIWIDFNPTRGHEQSSRRPALVISPKVYNAKVGLALVCPITSKIKDYPFEVRFSLNGTEGAILVDQIKSIDWKERHVQFCEKCDDEIVQEVQYTLVEIISN